MKSLLVGWVCALVVGCSGGCSGASESTTEEPSAASPEGSGGEGSARGGGQSDVPVDPGPPPTLRVTGIPSAHGRSVAVRIENRGTAAAELARGLSVQRRAEGVAWSEVGASLDLRYSCEDEAPECVTLAPGAAYLPPPWLGTLGDAQCACERCAAAEAGTYRFVVRSCNGAHVLEGEPFELRPD